MSLKHYRCAGCGYDTEIDTNHYGQCYSWGKYNACPNCSIRPTVWDCMVPLPEDGYRPADWKILTEEELAEVFCQTSEES
jgi:DNA-directed RNA polymerase subunit RPC12/RpoP